MSANPYAGTSKHDKMIEGRTRLLTCLHLIGAEESFVGMLELQKQYLTDYGRFLNKEELIRLFAKSSLLQVFSTYMKKDVEVRTDPDQTGSLFMQMLRPLDEALDDPPVSNHNHAPKISKVEVEVKKKDDINSRALEMFQTGQGADCVIEVVPQTDGEEKQEFNAHKYVLMVNSDVFHAMLSHKSTEEAREGRIQIKDSTGTAVRQMLIYLYTGELPQEYAIEMDAGPLLHIANKYQIQLLVQLVEQELVSSLSLANVIERLEMADLYQTKALYSACGQFIRRNLKMVKEEAKWMELKKKSPELVIALLEEFAEELENLNWLDNNHRRTRILQQFLEEVENGREWSAQSSSPPPSNYSSN